MNPENNLGNENQFDSMNSSTLGSVSLNNNTNSEPVQNIPNPTSNLSSIGLENLSNNIVNNQQNINAVNQDALNTTPVQPIGLSDAINNQVAQETSVSPDASSVVNNYSGNTDYNASQSIPSFQEPVINSTPVVEQPQNVGLNDVASANLSHGFEQTQPNYSTQDVGLGAVEQPVNTETAQNNVTPVNQAPEMPSGPTMPIPDTMPDVGYQAGVSTPVDYATPMTNFDEIGTTPELDPKAKMPGNKKAGKTLMFVLIILAIAALGAGSYYLINVKHIFDKSSVTVKNLTVEQGVPLSENINDYATFSNTSSSNCVQDLSKVDINVAGTYVYTIKCGDKEYTGKITVKDSTAPLAKLKANVVQVGEVANLTAESFVDSCYGEDCTSAISADQDLNITAKGVYPVKLEIKDQSSNSSDVIAPLIVMEGELHYGIIASKEIISNDDYKLIEKDAILYSDNGFVSYTMYEFTFNNTEMFNSQSGTDENGMIKISDYSGIPVYKYDEMKIVLVSADANNLVQGSYSSDREALTNVGYTVESFGKDHISILNY